MPDENLGLDVPETKETEPAKDADDRHVCELHHVRMKITNTKGKKRYLSCPVKECKTESQIEIREDIKKYYPSEPQYCPRCKTVACERAAKQLNPALEITLTCPKCLYTISTINPELPAQQLGFTRKAPVENVGDR